MEDLKLSINVLNIDEFQELLRKAKKESDQLKSTIEQIESFEFEIELKP